MAAENKKYGRQKFNRALSRMAKKEEP